jgi:hypothetical protein
MTTTVGNLVDATRSLVQGSLADSVSVLAEGYTPGQQTIKLAYPLRTTQAGGLMSVGLNTFQCLVLSSDGTKATVLPRADGGPDVPVNAGEVVRVKPRWTNWAIVREWNNGLYSMGSPVNGLYAYGSFTSVINWQSNKYPLPTTGNWETLTPLRLLIARYQQTYTATWQRIAAEWQPEIKEIRLYGAPPQNATLIEFVLAFPFSPATDLTTDVATLGLTTETMDLPGLFAASRLLLTNESRRNQLTAQGDARRPEEVPAGATLGASREFARTYGIRTQEEYARLVSKFGYWQTTNPVGSLI